MFKISILQIVTALAMAVFLFIILLWGGIGFFGIFVSGILTGSFLNVIIWRWPRGEKISGRSACPHCHKILSAWELVPLFSYVLLQGKCRNCKNGISPRYFIIEAITGFLFALVYSRFLPMSLADYFILSRLLIVVCVLAATFVIDLEHHLILDKLVLPASAIILVVNLCLDIFINKNLSFTINSIVAAIITAGAFYIVWFVSQGRWIGFGDVKLGLFLGLALGIPKIFVALFLAFILGGLVGAGLLASRKKTLKSQVPFGTFLTLGSFISILYGGSLLNWYLRLIGIA